MSRICIVVARFYEDLADELLKGAIAEAKSANVTCDLVEVPGAFEVPAAVRMAIASKKYEGYVTLGCVIRGETTHYDYVCGESARGLNELAINHMAPIGYGILTVENPEQAWVRAAIDQGNKGKDAMQACLRMIAIKNEMKTHD
jgi:6,7-dimethyl-8-ribityllumazine synthase